VVPLLLAKGNGFASSAPSASDNLSKCLTTLLRTPTFLKVFDPRPRLGLLSSSGSSSESCLSDRSDG
jgi:hypothetical protein